MIGMSLPGKHRTDDAPTAVQRLFQHIGRYGWLWLTAVVTIVALIGSNGLLNWLAAVLPAYF